MLTIWKHGLGFESARAVLYKWTTRTRQTYRSKTFANSPNEQKQQDTSKNRSRLWLSIVWETHKLTRYRRKEFSYTTFLYRTNTKVFAYNKREQILFIHIIHSAKLKNFSTQKNTPFPLTQSIKVHRGTLVLLLCLISFHRSTDILFLENYF